jgi:hypothetical protein
MNIIGRKFGRLVVQASLGLNKFNQPEYYCICKCGSQVKVSRPHLLQGFVKSCGCLRKPHGMSKTKFFNVWLGMIKRCRLKSRSDWNRYGGRGIKVCRSWHSFINFKNDMYQLYLEHKKNNSTTLLDRINNNKGYLKNNCRWVTAKISCRNRRSTHWIHYNGVKKTLTEWAN